MNSCSASMLSISASSASISGAWSSESSDSASSARTHASSAFASRLRSGSTSRLRREILLCSFCAAGGSFHRSGAAARSASSFSSASREAKSKTTPQFLRLIEHLLRALPQLT